MGVTLGGKGCDIGSAHSSSPSWLPDQERQCQAEARGWHTLQGIRLVRTFYIQTIRHDRNPLLRANTSTRSLLAKCECLSPHFLDSYSFAAHFLMLIGVEISRYLVSRKSMWKERLSGRDFWSTCLYCLEKGLAVQPRLALNSHSPSTSQCWGVPRW